MKIKKIKKTKKQTGKKKYKKNSQDNLTKKKKGKLELINLYIDEYLFTKFEKSESLKKFLKNEKIQNQ